jgi:hypothetical protein
LNEAALPTPGPEEPGPAGRWPVGLLKRTAVKLAVRDEAREHWGPSQVTDTSQKRHGFNYNKVTLFVPDPVSHHR